MSHTIGQVKQDTQQSSNSNQSHQDVSKAEATSLQPNSGLSDADYEFLFNQLLEGIAHGWHDRRIVKFFNQLGDRGQQADWIDWLERLRAKLLKLPNQSKRQWGTMMIRLGELTQSTAEVSQVGAVAHRLGRELLFDNNLAEIWEYAGPDLGLDRQIETEQEFSQRLPNDFDALGEQTIEVLNLPAEPDSWQDNSDGACKPPNEFGGQSLDDSDDDTKLNGNLWLENTDLAAASDLSNSDHRLRDFTQAPGEDNLLTNSSAAIAESADVNLDLDLDLNLDLERSPQTTSDENLELELEPELDPFLDDSSLEVIESWFNLGLKQVSTGEYTQAIASWDKALKLNANLPEAWHNRGSALGRLGNYEAAVKSFQSALAIDPNNYQAWNDRAHALYQLENWSGAIESWSQAIKLMPGNHLFWYNRGCALEQLAKWSEAIASYEKALEIKPDFQPGRSRYINLVADNSRPN